MCRSRGSFDDFAERKQRTAARRQRCMLMGSVQHPECRPSRCRVAVVSVNFDASNRFCSAAASHHRTAARGPFHPAHSCMTGKRRLAPLSSRRTPCSTTRFAGGSRSHDHRRRANAIAYNSPIDSQVTLDVACANSRSPGAPDRHAGQLRSRTLTVTFSRRSIWRSTEPSP